MRTYLVLAVACFLISGCGGGATSSVPPTPSNDTLSAANTNTATTTQLLVGTLNYVAWYNQSPLALLGRMGYSRSTPNDIRFAYTPTFSRVYVAFPQSTNIITNHVLEFDGTTHTVRRAITIGPYVTSAIAVTPDDRRLYVVTEALNLPSTADFVHVIDIATGKLLKRIQLPILSGHMWIASDHSGAHVYVFSDNEFGPNVLTRIDTATDTIAYNKATFPTSFNIGIFSVGMVLTPDDRTMNVAGVTFLNNTPTVYAIDTATGSIIARHTGTQYAYSFPTLDDSKCAQALYVTEFSRTGTLPITATLLTLNPRTLAVAHRVTLSGVQNVTSVGAAISGSVFLNAQLVSNAWRIESVDPATGKVLNSISGPQAANIYAQ